MEYDKCIQNSHNKMKTTLDIIKEEVGVNTHRSEIDSLIIDGRKVSVADEIKTN
jgi:hypothetical protein